MTRALLIGGPPQPLLEALSAEIARVSGVRRVRFRISALSNRLREATRHRATTWQGVAARAPDWIEPALRRFLPELVDELSAGADVALLSDPDLAPRFREIAELLPEARLVAVVCDGASLEDAPAHPAEGLDRARAWSRQVEPIAELADVADEDRGERVLVVRAEDLLAAPDAELARVLRHAGIGSAAAAWTGSPPNRPKRLEGGALQCFAAFRPARRALARFGYEVPEPGAECARHPAVALELARGWLLDGRAREVGAMLEDALRRSPDAPELHEALALLRARQGRSTESAHDLLRSISLAPERPEPWLRLFEDPSRPELLAVADYARQAREPAIRAAFARWLVARGLDPEAAEVVASVEHQAWR
jgi:hypothetical protein